jgi:hypothetical protein
VGCFSLIRAKLLSAFYARFSAKLISATRLWQVEE